MSLTEPPGTPRLWHFRVSHYNEKVRRWALDYKRWPHTRQTLIPGFHVPVVRWLSGQNQLPILRSTAACSQARPTSSRKSISETCERM